MTERAPRHGSKGPWPGLALMVVLVWPAGASWAADLRIGVLAHRGAERALREWRPTARYLSRRLPQHRFRIVPLGLEAMHEAVRGRDVDFVVVNGALYVELAARYGVTRTATLVNPAPGGAGTRFGAVIFTRADRPDITDLADLKGKSLIAVGPRAWGGWLMPRQELERHGVRPEDLRALRYSGYPLERLVRAVLDGEADAGTVRTDTLEALASEGKLRLAEVRVLNRRTEPGFPYLLSTPVYPEHAFARLSHVANEVARQVTAQLLLMPPDSPAARGDRVAGWTIPLSYQPIRRVLQDLKAPPYEHYGEVGLADALRQHWWAAAIIGLLLVVLAGTTLNGARLARRLHALAGELDRQVRDRTRALAASEERLRLALAASGQGLYDLNVQTGVAEVNEEYARMLGFEPASFRETNAAWIERLHPEDRERVVATYRDYLAGRLPEYRVELRQATADGGCKWILSLGRIVERDAQGRPLRMLGTHLDISKRKEAEIAAREAQGEAERLLAKSDQSRRALLSILEDQRRTEEALRRSEARLREAQRVAHVGSWHLDLETGHLEWSDEVYRIFEIDRARFSESYEAFLATVHPEDRARVDQAFRDSVAERAPYEITHRLQMADGRVKHVHERSETVYADDGRAVSAVGTVQDVTARVLAEEALRESEQRFRAIFDNALDGILVADATDQRFLDGNATLCRMLGYGRAELLGLGVRDIHPKEALPYVLDQFERQRRGEVNLAEDIPVMRKDGGVFYADISAAPFTLGGRTYLVGLFRDITERKQAEDQIRALNADLERRVRERTVELETANRELESFTYSVSHDLRAPLRAVTGFAQILNERQRDVLDEQGRHYLDNVIAAGQRMATLIEDLLEYSRTGRGAVRPRPVDLGAVLEGVRATFAERVARVGARVHVNVPLATPLGDPTLVGQVLSNLIDNALIYHAGTRDPVITVAAERQGDRVVLSVADNGIGIAPEYHEKVFEVFQRLHGQAEYPGTGVGLAIVAKAAHLMNGEVKVDSIPGQGSRFTVTLPAGEGYTGRVPSQTESDSIEAQT